MEEIKNKNNSFYEFEAALANALFEHPMTQEEAIEILKEESKEFCERRKLNFKNI